MVCIGNDERDRLGMAHAVVDPAQIMATTNPLNLKAVHAAAHPV